MYDPEADAELKTAMAGMTLEEKRDYFEGPLRAITQHDFEFEDDRPSRVLWWEILECGHRKIVTIVKSGNALCRTQSRCRACSPRPHRITDYLR